jgi:hypothetical protein
MPNPPQKQFYTPPVEKSVSPCEQIRRRPQRTPESGGIYRETFFEQKSGGVNGFAKLFLETRQKCRFVSAVPHRQQACLKHVQPRWGVHPIARDSHPNDVEHQPAKFLRIRALTDKTQSWIKQYDMR